VDRVIDYQKGDYAIGLKNVTFNEPHFQGHFPGHSVMPGVLVIEALAQTASIFVSKTLDGETAGKIVYFTSIENAKFRKPVVPGDCLHLKVTKITYRRNLWKFKGEAIVDGAIVAEATFSAMIMDNL